jgi:hypothetical protein
MPTCKVQYKYKCGEVACGKLIRGDKWNAHCKKDHGYKFSRGIEVKRTISMVKHGDGQWICPSVRQVSFVESLTFIGHACIDRADSLISHY